MKKILLTLFAVAAVFVACDKDGLDQEITNINVLEQAEEIGASVEADLDVQGVIDELLNNLSSFGNQKRGQANLTSKTGDFVAVHIFTISGQTDRFLILADETNDDFCFPGSVATVFFDNVNGDGSQLNVEDTSGAVSVSLTGDFSAFFAGGNNVLVRLNANNKAADRGDFNAGNTATLSGTDFTFACGVDVSGFYTVTPAPFPLTGFLARINDDASFTGTSLNYAASTDAAVRAAIEGDIMDGN